jgi:hypothetical protein
MHSLLKKTRYMLLAMLACASLATAQDAKFGVMIQWSDAVDHRNADGLAMQLQAVGAQYLQIGGGGNFADLSAALAKRNIKLMAGGASNPSLTLASGSADPKAPPRFTVEEAVALSRKVTDGPVTWDTPIQPTGLTAGPYLDRLAAVGASLGRIPSVPQFQSNLPVNYDEAKVGTYTLPDVMKFADGKPVRTAKDWERRRTEILHLFETNIYGHSPGRPADLKFIVTNPEPGLRKVVLDFGTQKVEMLLFHPPDVTTRIPVLLQLSFAANDAPAIRTQAERVMSHGYGFATIHYTDFQPDNRDALSTGVRALAPNEDWGTISAWAWGYSRAMDYLVTDGAVDPTHVAVTGMSRLGKTVLWAGAQDQRFALVWANCSGEGGAALARRNYGETAAHMGLNYGYQYTPKYRQWGEHVDQMPTDQHELLALIAPRPLYLATGEDDKWSDPRGEFLSAVAAGPVYRLLGKTDLGTTEMPPLNEPIMHDIGYHYRTGRHAVTDFDWEQALKFMDMHWKR